ncbi:hypothetical protein B0T25DRAFT_497387 [Lasiosphaeria hispida]|uniref:FAD/NAD(P)-binding domain-containing protein n=1 Tax=Lasiosphaeria hispida TaxID=260671 RepID=A0AAJ0MFG7_9PEZI|nr:hypothetical protein B0T25DRAFT_497387 [Lasiosphaeria hispida]
MAPQKVQKAVLFTRLVGYAFRMLFSHLQRVASTRLAAWTALSPTLVDASDVKNIVVVGAAFAGYFATKVLANSLPRNGKYRVVVIEPNSHFNFTWVLPRFCIVEGHENKAFIPYTPDFFAQAPDGIVSWVRDRVLTVGKTSVRLQGGEEIPYEFLIIATGSTVPDGLPSRLGVDNKEEGVQLLKGVQAKIRAASHVVVAGGGAAGVELATDAKHQYPDKSVTLVHSRPSVMHRFGPELQAEAMKALERLGVDVILEEKAMPGSADGTSIDLKSGRVINCDCLINCTGQRPASDIIAELSPDSISPTGHIKVKPTLQIADDSLPNIYVCGDVSETHDSNPNSRIAARQAQIAADNIVSVVRGRAKRRTYSPEFGDGVIKLTLGLDSSIMQFWDGKSELLFSSKETDLALMCRGAWSAIGAKPFVDTGVYKGQSLTAHEFLSRDRSDDDVA